MEVHAVGAPPKMVPAYPRLHLSAAESVSLALASLILLLAFFVESESFTAPRKERKG